MIVINSALVSLYKMIVRVCDVNQKVEAGWIKQSMNFDVIRKYHSNKEN